jgi:hypothetical protein
VNGLSAGLVPLGVLGGMAVVLGGMLDVAAASFGLMWLIEFARRLRLPPLRDRGRRAVTAWREWRAARPRWTDAEIAALRAKASLEDLLAATPRVQREAREQ